MNLVLSKHLRPDMEQLYRIEELATNGWFMIEKTHRQLTKEQAKKIIDSLINEGYNPNLLRAVPEPPDVSNS